MPSATPRRFLRHSPTGFLSVETENALGRAGRCSSVPTLWFAGRSACHPSYEGECTSDQRRSFAHGDPATARPMCEDQFRRKDHIGPAQLPSVTIYAAHSLTEFPVPRAGSGSICWVTRAATSSEFWAESSRDTPSVHSSATGTSAKQASAVTTDAAARFSGDLSRRVPRYGASDPCSPVRGPENCPRSSHVRAIRFSQMIAVSPTAPTLIQP